MSITESVVEEAVVDWLGELGYRHLHGSVIAPDGEGAERSSYGDVILAGRLREALARLNPHLEAEVLDEVARRVMRPDSPSVLENNHRFQQWLSSGMTVQVRRKGGMIRGDQAWLVDFEEPERNDWLVVTQLTVVEGKHTRRPDVVVYVNGLPIAVIELKNPGAENATVRSAWNQLQTYKDQIPSLFDTNGVLVVSDGSEALVGSLTAGFERFGPWRTVDGQSLAPEGALKLEVLLEGLFEKRRLLDYLRHFVLWETDEGYIKKIAGYHQYHAVNKAVHETVRASAPRGDKRIGVVWHTQGSGKSISMVFYAAKLIVQPEMKNPTLVVITDRNDLDGQLYGQFCAARDLIPHPVQAESREHLRELLQVASGGVVFTTLQKFGVPRGERFPTLSERRNIVVITDEAHRSHYEFIEGFARNLRDGLPNASFIGFTGTPIEHDDKSTPAVFGDYIDTYTISQAVDDNATVPIYYEARLAKIALAEDQKPVVDEEFEEVTEGEEESVKGKLKTKWAKLEAMVGTGERLALIARDMVEHFERRTEILEGKAMIVAMSRRIAVDLYDQIVRLRPQWDAEADEQGEIKVVMTGAASDPPRFQKHLRSKVRQKVIENRFKDPDDPLRMVIVRDMWLTGFDAPPAHTLYVDKPMRGHGLMQAIARVNRVFKDKPAGLVVDYLGLADQLRRAVGTYGGQQGEKPGVPVDVALAVLEEKLGIVRDMFHGFDYGGYFGTKASDRMAALAGGADHICGLEDGKKRFLEAMVQLNKAAGIAIHLEGARDKRDEVGYFQALQKNLKKYTVGGSGKSDEELNAAIRQIVSKAVSSEGVVDIFGQAGLKKPDISILSDEFLEEVQTSSHKNLQLELLRKLLNDEIRSMRRRNIVQSRKFSEMLEKTLLGYKNRSLEAAQVILELIELAKNIRDTPKRGDKLRLTEDELAFYDALADHGNVRELMEDKVLARIARDLVEAIRRSVTIDWTQKEAVRADMRRKVKRLLRKHGYPPDKRQEAVETVIEQAETLCKDWAERPPEAPASVDDAGQVLPFRKLSPAEVRPFENCVPLYDLKVAAGRFSDEQVVNEVPQEGELENPEDYEWVTFSSRVKPSRGLFVAQVVGESMNRRIPSGSWCLFRLDTGGSHQGKVVLAQHRDIQDPELGGQFTLKLYYSEKEQTEDGELRHRRITLSPDSSDPTFVPIVLEDLEEGELTVIAEIVAVLA
jgi:type I restriction enzyme R subunit